MPAKPKSKAAPKGLKYYPAFDVPKPLKRKVVRKPTKLRASITPGSVLILLAGRFKGKRVIFLKQLPSGLLLVTGPYKVNGVPARRINQVYCIATSTKVDVSGVDVSKFTDDYFKKAPKVRATKSEAGFFAEQTKAALPAAYKAAQKALDDALLPKIDKVKDLKGYLSNRFTLNDGMRPHLMKF